MSQQKKAKKYLVFLLTPTGTGDILYLDVSTPIK
jgi:hypothetical protein